MSQEDKIADPSQDPDLQLIAAHEAFANNVKKKMKSFKDPQVKNFINFLEIIDPEARDSAFRESKPKRGFLTELAIFVSKYFPIKAKPSSTTLKSMTTQELLTFVLKSTISASPSSCKDCNEIFNIGSKTEFKCFCCGTELCPKCITEEAVSRIKEVIKNAVVICIDCDVADDSIANIEVEITSQDSQEQSSSSPKEEEQTLSQLLGSSSIAEEGVVNEKETIEEASNSDDDKIEVTEIIEVAKTVKSKSKSSKEVKKKEEEKEKEEVEKKKTEKVNSKNKEETEKKICLFYVQFRCKHGRAGKECDFAHPKICLTLMNKGSKGCPSSENCEYIHPRMCSKSINGNKCENRKCLLGHVQGTKDIKVVQNKAKNEEVIKTSKKPANFHSAKPGGHTPQKEILTKEETPSLVPASQTSPQSQQDPQGSPPANAQTSALEIITLSLKTLTEQLTQMQKTNQEELLNLWKMVSMKQQPQQSYAGALSQNSLQNSLQNPQQFFLQGMQH